MDTFPWQFVAMNHIILSSIQHMRKPRRLNMIGLIVHSLHAHARFVFEKMTCDWVRNSIYLMLLNTWYDALPMHFVAPMLISLLCPIRDHSHRVHTSSNWSVTQFVNASRIAILSKSAWLQMRTTAIHIRGWHQVAWVTCCQLEPQQPMFPQHGGPWQCLQCLHNAQYQCQALEAHPIKACSECDLNSARRDKKWDATNCQNDHSAHHKHLPDKASKCTHVVLNIYIYILRTAQLDVKEQSFVDGAVVDDYKAQSVLARQCGRLRANLLPVFVFWVAQGSRRNDYAADTSHSHPSQTLLKCSYDRPVTQVVSKEARIVGVKSAWCHRALSESQDGPRAIKTCKHA